MKSFFGLFEKENSVRGASLILMFTLAFSNVMGLLRDRFLTKNISTYYLDIYYAGFRIPDLIFNFLILGAITAAFIPIFSDFIAEKKLERGYRVANSLINLAVITMIVMAVLLYFLMPALMPLVVPKFDAVRMELSIRYARLLMFTPIFFSISYIFGGMLNSYKRFLAYSLAPLFYNLSIIIGAAFFAPKYGVTAVIYTVIVGSFIHMLVQLPGVLKLGYRPSFIIDLKDKALLRIFRLMVPRTIGMGVNQVMLLMYTAIASTLAIGSISAFNLANNIQTMPSVVFGTSFATAVFPTLTAKISSGDKEGFAFYLSRSIRSIAFLLVPSSIAFILLRAQIIRLILGSGKFDWDDTRKTALALGFFSISLLAQGLIPLLARAFYALKNTRTPMYISIVTVAVSVLLGYPLASTMGVAGLALAFSIGSFVNLILLYYYLQKVYPHIWNREIVVAFSKITLISIMTGLILWGTLHLVAGYVDMNRFIGVLTQTLLSSAVAVGAYLGLSHLFNIEEMKWALTRRINGENNKTKS